MPAGQTSFDLTLNSERDEILKALFGGLRHHSGKFKQIGIELQSHLFRRCHARQCTYNGDSYLALYLGNRNSLL